MTITFQQLKLALNLNNVERFSTHRFLKRKSVAEHSFRVAALYAYFSGQEIEAALFHDIEEAVTGDIPGPVKPKIQGLEYYADMRPKFLSVQEKQLCKLCDKVELLLDLQEQVADLSHLPRKLLNIYEDEYNLCQQLSLELKIGHKLTEVLSIYE